MIKNVYGSIMFNLHVEFSDLDYDIFYNCKYT